MITPAQKREINARYRTKDDSHLWPICGRFNVTERAIRQARKLAHYNGEFNSSYEYEAVLDHLCGQIVNDPRNY